MGAVNIETVGDLMRHRTLLRVTCRACGHTGLFDPRDMIIFFGAGRRLDRLPLVCRECGSRDIDSRPDHESLLAYRDRPAKPKPKPL
jgi:DNA-directed RNA polymerase subunit RPC12/RpoP